MVQLTELQSKVMEFIFGCLDSTGMPPTLREIAAHFSWKAVGSAQDVVLALRKKGVLLPPEPGKSRQLVPSQEALKMFRASSRVKARVNATHSLHEERGSRASQFIDSVVNIMRVPVLGMVQAGNPAEAIETAGNHVVFMDQGKKSSESQFFSVVVDGYSMMNAGFLPGDYLLVESTSEARNGDIVVAAVKDHEVTVKRFAMRGSQLYRQSFEKVPPRMRTHDVPPPALLIPENPDFEPLPFGTTDNDKIIGLVRSLYRKDIM